MMSCLRIKDLHVSVDGKEILKGLSLDIHSGETHALMGPNGNGKSTLLAAIMGNPKFQVTGGSITLDDQDVLAMEVDERSKAGLFLGMQYPSEVSGVTNSDFLRAAINARRERPIPLFSFIREMEKTIRDLQMKEDLAHRFLNEGFSGGEKKRNEIVQMKLLKPSIAMLDEIDSGLDVDAVRTVSKGIQLYKEKCKGSLLIITHSTRILESLHVDVTDVMDEGKVVKNGDASLVDEINENGFEEFEQ